MDRPSLPPRHRPARAWVLGLVVGIVAGVASVYLLLAPPTGGTIAATLAPLVR